jgi:hypothetical protein
MEMMDEIRHGRPYGSGNDPGTLLVIPRICWNKQDLLEVRRRLVIAAAIA